MFPWFFVKAEAYAEKHPAYGMTRPAYGLTRLAYGLTRPAGGLTRPGYGKQSKTGRRTHALWPNSFLGAAFPVSRTSSMCHVRIVSDTRNSYVTQGSFQRLFFVWRTARSSTPNKAFWKKCPGSDHRHRPTRLQVLKDAQNLGGIV